MGYLIALGLGLIASGAPQDVLHDWLNDPLYEWDGPGGYSLRIWKDVRSGRIWMVVQRQGETVRYWHDAGRRFSMARALGHMWIRQQPGGMH